MRSPAAACSAPLRQAPRRLGARSALAPPTAPVYRKVSRNGRRGIATNACRQVGFSVRVASFDTCCRRDRGPVRRVRDERFLVACRRLTKARFRRGPRQCWLAAERGLADQPNEVGGSAKRDAADTFYRARQAVGASCRPLAKALELALRNQTTPTSSGSATTSANARWVAEGGAFSLWIPAPSIDRSSSGSTQPAGHKDIPCKESESRRVH